VKATLTQNVNNAAYTTFGPFLVEKNDSGIAVDIENGGANALASVAVDIQETTDGEFWTILQDADFASTSSVMPLVSGTRPDTLAAGAKSHFQLQIPVCWAIQVRVKGSNATPGAVTVRTLGR